MQKIFLEKIEIPIEKCLFVEPNFEYQIEEINVKTVPAYNTNKEYHLKEYNWCGYLVNVDNTCYYIAGDTDNIEENYNIKCDIAFIPIGGTFTMNVKEAIEYIKQIKPLVVIPIHYGSIVGNKEDGLKLKKILSNLNIQVELKLG